MVGQSVGPAGVQVQSKGSPCGGYGEKVALRHVYLYKLWGFP
jgi:hypothetical protein